MIHLLGQEDDRATNIPGLTLIRRTQLEPPSAYLCAPSLAMIVQGRKCVMLGDTTLTYDESSFLLTAANLPTTAQVLEATSEAPFLSILLMLDLTAARQIIAEIDPRTPETNPGGAGLSAGPATPELFESLHRLLALQNQPQDIPVLSGLIQREVLYRLLTSPAGARLRQIVHLGTSSNRTARAIDWLRGNFTQPFRMEALASAAGMGVSTLHQHFRQMTAMSPLQFQKQLRLHEARRLMLSEELDAGSAALRVGYESATQFNREYRRLFGTPPMRDVKALRQANAANPRRP